MRRGEERRRGSHLRDEAHIPAGVVLLQVETRGGAAHLAHTRTAEVSCVCTHTQGHALAGEGRGAGREGVGGGEGERGRVEGGREGERGSRERTDRVTAN